MINLSNVTIVTANCVKPIDGIRAIKYSQRGINFKEAVLFTDKDIRLDGIRTEIIPTLKNVDDYNDFILRLGDYIDSDYVLVVHDDGFVLNPDLFDPEFLKYDYIGAQWPQEKSWSEIQRARDYMHFNPIGNGGFSLRSRKFLELSARFNSCMGFGEDCFLNCVNYGFMWANGVKYPPVELANKFSMENNLENWEQPMHLDPKSTFGFHGKNFINSPELIELKENL